MGRIATVRIGILIAICGAGCILSPASAQHEATDLSGIWKIQSLGPVPLCEIKHSASVLTGSCTRPKATGGITGTVSGKEVRRRWEWLNYSTKARGYLQFAGTLQADATIMGKIEGGAIYPPLNFTATRQLARPAAQSPQPNQSPQPDQSPQPNQSAQPDNASPSAIGLDKSENLSQPQK